MRSRARFGGSFASVALVLLLLFACGSIAPALGAPKVISPASAMKAAKRALKLAKKADSQSLRALTRVRRRGPAGPAGPAGLAGPRGSEGLDGPVGPDGDRGPRGVTGPAGQAEQGATGPGGATGADGPAGATGPAGAPGADGAPGQPGAPGTARAYATIRPDGGSGNPALVGSRTLNVTAVARPAADVYCLSLGGGIDAATTSPVVSVDAAGSPAGAYAAVDTTAADCAGNKVEVRTSGSAPNAVGFTIAIP